jgi:hypothetical protein
MMGALEDMLAERKAYRAKLEPALRGFRNLQPLPHLSGEAQAEVSEDIAAITKQLQLTNAVIALLEQLIDGLDEGDFPNLPKLEASPAVLAELTKNEEANKAALASLTAEVIAAANLGANPFKEAQPDT